MQATVTSEQFEFRNVAKRDTEHTDRSLPWQVNIFFACVFFCILNKDIGVGNRWDIAYVDYCFLQPSFYSGVTVAGWLPHRVNISDILGRVCE